jgi:molybdate transport system ATP-binding protein
MREFLANIHREFKLPIILVTHDLFEACSLADKIIIYSQGRVLQSGSPAEILKNTEDPMVKKLLDVEKFCHCGILAKAGR